jgi:alkaline phosphatase D
MASKPSRWPPPQEDPLAAVSILGRTQREWWKRTMRESSTWKLWCNEVSLLRMQLNGTDAIATLFALEAVSSLGSASRAAGVHRGQCAGGGGHCRRQHRGASQTVAAAAGAAIGAAAAPLATPRLRRWPPASARPRRPLPWPLSTGRRQPPQGAAAQVSAGAQTIAFGYIKPDIQARGVNSSFVQASGRADALKAYFDRFLFNCDQWDGFNAERKALMAHLKGGNIRNVVALTGDLHCFDAGVVMDDHDAASPQPVMRTW